MFAADTDSYGLQRGSVGVNVAGGAWINGGTHPTVHGGLDVGLAKYVGLWFQAGEGLAYNAQVGVFSAGGGVMVAATNKSRIVPFGKFGAMYNRSTLFGYGGVNVPVLAYGGGFDVYASRHFGIETQVGGGHSVGRFGGGNSATITFGAFYRSK